MTQEDEGGVATIQPNYAVEAIRSANEIHREITDDDVRVLGYPKYLAEFDVELRRVFMSNRHVQDSVTIDGISGGGMRNDVFPEIERRDIPKSALLRPRLEESDALASAEDVVRRHVSLHYPQAVLIFGIQELTVVRSVLAYKLFWIVPDDPAEDSVSIFDTITGDVIEQGVSLAKLTADDLSDR
ncbi:MAG: hypothetical protein ACOCR6_02035 [archaeon]